MHDKRVLIKHQRYFVPYCEENCGKHSSQYHVWSCLLLTAICRHIGFQAAALAAANKTKAAKDAKRDGSNGGKSPPPPGKRELNIGMDHMPFGALGFDASVSKVLVLLFSVLKKLRPARASIWPAVLAVFESNYFSSVSFSVPFLACDIW
jgi:hypothetical protein